MAENIEQVTPDQVNGEMKKLTRREKEGFIEEFYSGINALIEIGNIKNKKTTSKNPSVTKKRKNIVRFMSQFDEDSAFKISSHDASIFENEILFEGTNMSKAYVSVSSNDEKKAVIWQLFERLIILGTILVHNRLPMEQFPEAPQMQLASGPSMADFMKQQPAIANLTSMLGLDDDFMNEIAGDLEGTIKNNNMFAGGGLKGGLGGIMKLMQSEEMKSVADKMAKKLEQNQKEGTVSEDAIKEEVSRMVADESNPMSGALKHMLEKEEAGELDKGEGNMDAILESMLGPNGPMAEMLGGMIPGDGAGAASAAGGLLSAMMAGDDVDLEALEALAPGDGANMEEMLRQMNENRQKALEDMEKGYGADAADDVD